MRPTRPINWLKGARRDFEEFPVEAQLAIRRALTVAAEGGKSDLAKPFKGVDGGVFEIALPHRGDAYRVVYALMVAEAIWVVHAFKKKSKKGVKTPQADVDLIRERARRLKEALG